MAAAGTWALPAAMRAAPAKTDRPNILLIITDQQHFNTIRAAGCPHVLTPGLDSLAASGTRFTESYCANPLTGPSHSTLMTSRMSSETGVITNGLGVRDGIPNVGQWLRDRAGYRTVMAGVWALPEWYPRGISGFQILNSGITVQGGIMDTGVCLSCEAFLRNRTSPAPFFMLASFLQPHDICGWVNTNHDLGVLPYPELAGHLPPLPPNFAHYDAFEPRYLIDMRNHRPPRRNGWYNPQHWQYYLWSYYRHVEQVDMKILRLLQTLRDTGQAERTLVVMTSDHGEGMACHETVFKSTPYDEATRVNLIASWPGHIPQGLVNDTHLVHGADLLPTFCDYAGVVPPPNARGRSLRPIFEKTGAPWRDYLFVELEFNRARMVRSRQFKYATCRDDPVEQLFDLRNDPHEMVNLIRFNDYADVAAEHRAALASWERQLVPAPSGGAVAADPYEDEFPSAYL